ncbi:Uncharacterised protein [Mycobacteroides abscessus]|nr:Uncharacterised protein [Mycobacteroides abscessus]
MRTAAPTWPATAARPVASASASTSSSTAVLIVHGTSPGSCSSRSAPARSSSPATRLAATLRRATACSSSDRSSSRPSPVRAETVVT